jgi:hypothetical protein
MGTPATTGLQALPRGLRARRSSMRSTLEPLNRARARAVTGSRRWTDGLG